jgi:hypothetical protein
MECGNHVQVRAAAVLHPVTAWLRTPLIRDRRCWGRTESITDVVDELEEFHLR